METIKLYHATSSIDIAFEIEKNGFRGNNIWEYKDVVFFADKPLKGFGRWQDVWVEIEIPKEFLNLGVYDEKFWDDDQYNASCYCFKSDFVNQFNRKVYFNKEY